MGTKSVRLDEDVYELVSTHKRADESFSDAIERLITPPSLLELAGILSDEAADEWREAIERSADRDRKEAAIIVDRFGE